MAIKRTGYTEWSGSSSNVTISHDASSYYRGMVVGLIVDSDVNPVLTSIKYAGIDLTSLGYQVLNITSSRLYLYYLTNPTIGVNDLVIDAGSFSVSKVMIGTYANVLQASMTEGFTSGSDGGNAGSWTVTTAVLDDWIVSAIAEGVFSSGSGFTGGSNLTLLGNSDISRFGDSNASVGVAGAKTVGATYNANDPWYYLSIAIKPAVSVPILTTSAVSNISFTTAQANGESLYDGDATITQRGFCYSTSSTPTIADSTKIASGTIGSYTADLTGLSLATTYYVRSYATNSNGTGYGDEVSFTTDNIGQYELQKDIDASEGQTILGRINVTGTLGTVTVQLGTTGTATVIAAGSGDSLFSGTYSGLSGLIITRSATFNGTIDNVYYVSAPLDATVDWTLDTLTIISAIDSSVFFKRIEDEVFNSFTFYRYLDLLFKDLDGFVTVTIRDEREDVTTEREKIFSVGNTETGTVSPFQKKKISFLIKNQAVIIGLSNANVNETFSIAQFLITGHHKPSKMFSPSKIISLS